jgi:hypothetical protein
MHRVADKFRNWIYRNRLEVLLVLLVISVYGYFFSCGGSNQNARFNVIFSFVEPGTSDSMTFRIDRFMVDPEKGINTYDWSFYRGHYYSNKAPGSSFLGIPVYTVILTIERLLGMPWQHPYIEILNAYLINFFVSVLPVSLGILFFFRLLILRGASLRRALMFSLILAFATCIFPYSTELWGHPTAMALIIFAVYCIQRGNNYNYILAGLFLGFATLTDYLALFVTVTTGLYVLYMNWKKIPLFCSRRDSSIDNYAFLPSDMFRACIEYSCNFHQSHVVGRRKSDGIVRDFFIFSFHTPACQYRTRDTNCHAYTIICIARVLFSDKEEGFCSSRRLRCCDDIDFPNCQRVI